MYEPAVEAASVEVLVARTNAGVLGFGTDADMRSTFDSYGITNFDLHTIEVKRLRYESGERGLLREALTRAIARNRGLKSVHRGHTDLLVPLDLRDNRWSWLKQEVGLLSGKLTGYPQLQWSEGLGLRLEWADDRLWLLVEPRQCLKESMMRTVLLLLTSRARGRSAVITANLMILLPIGPSNSQVTAAIYAVSGSSDGVDGVFRLSADTAYSRRVWCMSSEIARMFAFPSPSLRFIPRGNPIGTSILCSA